MAKRILIADDEPLTAEMLSMVLAFTGFDVVEARDGREALERARETRPDVVLLDVMMPRLLGPEVARTLRADPRFADVPVVLFSCVDESEVDWRGAGADLFLQKPVDVRELPSVLRRLTGAGEDAGRAASD